MKKLTKSLLVGAMVLPCAFAFVGCGGDQLSQKASCNTSGVYAESSVDDFNSVVGDRTESMNITGYRMALEVNGTISGSRITETINAIIVEDEIALRTSESINGYNVSSDAYYTDGYIYTSSNGLKIKMAVDFSDVIGVFSVTSGMITDLDGMLGVLDGCKIGDLTIGKVEEDNVARYKIESSASVEGLSNIVMYFNFEDGKLYETQFEANMSASYGEEPYSLSIKFVMSKYDGKIQFPSFDGYTSM